MWSWCITVLSSSTVLSILPLTSVLFFVSGIVTLNETGNPSGDLVTSLDLCGTIISRLNCYPRITLNKELFSVIIEALFFCRKVHEKRVLHAIPSPRSMETFTGCLLTKKVVLEKITELTSTHLFPSSLYFPPYNPLILNGSTLSRSFKYANFNTKLGWSSATDWCYSRFPKSNLAPVSAKNKHVG